MEKLNANLLDIRQMKIVTDQNPGGETEGKDSEIQTHIYHQVFEHMQKELNDCIRHHQDTKRCDYIQLHIQTE
jgi:hypothetical protein